MMKLRRLYQAGFAFTSLLEFEIPFPNSVHFPGKSINDILYIWEPTSLVSNAVTTRSASKKRKILEIDDHVEDVEGVEDIHSQSGSETIHPNIQPIGEAEKLTNFQLPQIGERESQSSFSSPLSTTSHPPVKPLYCSPNQLWHLRFGHASSTTLHKLPYIKSSHDSTRCVCIRAKQTRKPFYPSASKVSHKLERIHSNICGLFATSKGLTKLLLSMTKLLLTFLDEYSQWCWIATIDDKSSATDNREFECSSNKSSQKASSKVDTQSTTGMGLRTKGLCQLSRPHLFETQFPKASDFDEPPAHPYDRSTSSPEPEPRPIFDEIIVQRPPALRIFKTYGDIQPDNDSPSFSFIDAMR